MSSSKAQHAADMHEEIQKSRSCTKVSDGFGGLVGLPETRHRQYKESVLVDTCNLPMVQSVNVS